MRASIAISVLLGSLLLTLPAAGQPQDSKSIGVFTGAGTTPPGLSCPVPSPPMRCSGFLASDVDGTLLDVTVTVPDASGPHPLVAFIHGYGGSKNSSSSYDDALAARGYSVLRYSTRGFGDSWGQVNLSHIDVEVADLRSLIGQVVEDPRLLARADAVAVAGASYGGGHSWLAAARPAFTTPRGTKVQIRTVVPIAAWSDLLASLRPNGADDSVHPPGSFKLSFLEGLFLGGIRRSPTRPYPNYPDYLWLWNGYALATEPNNLPPVGTSLVDGLTYYRSILWRPEFWSAVDAGNGIPVFLVQGFTDDLFPLPEALRMYQAIRARSPSLPIAAYFGDIGHPRAANKSGEVSYALELIFAWLKHYLQDPTAPAPSGVTAAITRPGAPFNPATDIVQVPDWKSLSTATSRASFDGSQVITFDPANVAGLFVDPFVFAGCDALSPNPCVAPAPAVVPGDVAVYSVPARALAASAGRGAGSFLIAGQPAVSFQATTSAGREQLDARLYRVAGTVRQLVTRGTITLDSGSPFVPLGTREVVLQTYGNLFEVSDADSIELELTNVDSPYLSPSRIPSVTVLREVQLTVPIR